MDPGSLSLTAAGLIILLKGPMKIGPFAWTQPRRISPVRRPHLLIHLVDWAWSPVSVSCLRRSWQTGAGLPSLRPGLAAAVDKDQDRSAVSPLLGTEETGTHN